MNYYNIKNNFKDINVLDCNEKVPYNMILICFYGLYDIILLWIFMRNECIYLKTKIVLNSIEDTKKLAKIIADYAFSGMIIGLAGDLGSGKTTFTKYLAKNIGVNDNINSPTFTILKIYQGNYDLYHMDVYRLEEVGYDYELDDFIYGEGVSVIEWYTYIRDQLPEELLTIDIQANGEFQRSLLIEGKGRYEKIIEAINNRYSN